VEKRPDFGRTDVEALRQAVDGGPRAGQGGLQPMHSWGKRHGDARWRDGLCPKTIGLCEGTGQIVFNLSGRQEALGSEFQGLRRHHLGGGDLSRTMFEAPGDRAALLAFDAVKCKDGRTRPHLFEGGTPECVFELGMAGQHHREARAPAPGLCEELCEPPACLPMQVVGIVHQ